MTAATNRTLTKGRASLAARVDAASLSDANINPKTGLATDYLNHFNEAIMLLELLAEMPECREYFFAWQPRNYDEHFAASNFQHRDIAIAAYAAADPALRGKLDTLASTMNEILLATREVMRQDLSPGAVGAIADMAVRWIKPLVTRAGSVINGTEVEQSHVGWETAPQAAVDAILAR
jgi:hypothetical protein